MAELSIIVVFAGLIAFVPNQVGHHEYLTAYLVNDGVVQGDCNHTPMLSVFGRVEVKAGSLCKEVGKEITECSLQDVDVHLDPMPKERIKFMPANAPGKVPGSSNSDKIGWLVRMANVESSAKTIKRPGDLGSLTNSSFRFGWDSAKTCKIDDNGTDNVYAFRFDPGGHEQALAETVLFSVKVEAGPVKVVLRARDGKVPDTILELKCPQAKCPVLSVSNDLGDSCDIDGHFGMHYGLANGTVMNRPLPSRTGMPVKEVQDSCVIPTKPSLYSHLRASGLSFFKSRKLAKRLTRRVLDPKPDDRIICPPVVFDPLQ